MRRTPVLCVAACCLAAACGDGLHPAVGDAAVRDAASPDTAPVDAVPPDAAAIAPCAPVTGTRVAMRRLAQPVTGAAVHASLARS
jgi:hypothetical protein